MGKYPAKPGDGASGIESYHLPIHEEVAPKAPEGLG